MLLHERVTWAVAEIIKQVTPLRNALDPTISSTEAPTYLVEGIVAEVLEDLEAADSDPSTVEVAEILGFNEPTYFEFRDLSALTAAAVKAAAMRSRDSVEEAYFLGVARRAVTKLLTWPAATVEEVSHLTGLPASLIAKLARRRGSARGGRKIPTIPGYLVRRLQRYT